MTLIVLLIALSVLVLLAAVTFVGARMIERAHPPPGRFVEVGGARLHVVDLGRARASQPDRRWCCFTGPVATSKTCGSRSARASPRVIA
jgi:hypothetical protein